ncbi:hypothetical protein PENTCL1PPCAC_28836, partial [Pristionchus entomophagus]
CQKNSISFAPRPAHPGEKDLPKHERRRLSEIDQITGFRHEDASHINHEEEVPEGEGEFLIKWKGREQPDWVHADDVFQYGVSAVRKYFEQVREQRDTHANKFMNTITHISSLNDIICDGIMDETETHYKMNVVGLSEDFIYELSHPEWGKNINKLFEIVREDGQTHVWVNHIHAKYMFRKSVIEFEREKRRMPSVEEIEEMDMLDFARYLMRKDDGFYE